jgi:NADPH:quinone reductase-like Zn-dependent oxidoreductase
MKAVFVVRYGGPEVMEFRETDTPVPGNGQILVRVRAIGLNFADVFGRLGVYPGTPKPPFIPGLEFSGDVVSIGPRVRLFKGGERVMGYSRLGSHAEFVTLDERFTAVLPAGMTYEQGASFLATSLSAYHGVVRLANTRRGEKILIHAAAGGVGLAAVQLAKHLGAEIFATAGTDEKLALARSHGALHLINYTAKEFDKEVENLTEGYGVDVIMDSVGGDVFKRGWQILAPMGRYVLFGVSSVTGDGALNRLKAAYAYTSMRPIFPPTLISANRGLFGFNLGTLHGREGYFREAVYELLDLHKAGVIRPLIGRIFPFAQIVEAHRYLQTRQSVGKVVVLGTPDS